MNIQLYSISESWRPPQWARCDYDVSTEEFEDIHEQAKKLDPKRFERLVPKNYYLFNGGYLLRSIIPIASCLLSITALTMGNHYFFGINPNHKVQPLVYLSMGLSCLIERVSHYFFSPRPTQENLDAAILEASRNPIIQKLLNQTSEGHEIKINLVDRSFFKEKSISMAHHFIGKDLQTGEKKSIIEIWNGKRSFRNFLFDMFETANSYGSNTNPIIWNANPLSLVIFEMINAFQRNKFAAVTALARKGEINRKEYVVLKEFVESGTVNLFCRVVQYGIEHMGWDPNWFHIKGTDLHLKNLEKGEVHFFKEHVWPADISEAPGKTSHARYYSDQWYDLGLSELCSSYENLTTPEFLKKVREAPIEEWRNELKGRLPNLNTDEFAEAEDFIISLYLNAHYESLKEVFSFMKNKKELLQIEKQYIGPKLDELRQFFKDLLKRRKIFKDFYIELKKDTSKITEKDFENLSHTIEGRCLLLVLEDSLFEEQESNLKVDLDYLRAFLKKNKAEDLNLHARWLLEENYSTQSNITKSAASAA